MSPCKLNSLAGRFGGRGIFSAKAGIGEVVPAVYSPPRAAVAGYSEGTSKHPATLSTMHTRLGRISNPSKVPIRCIQPNLFTLSQWLGSRLPGGQSQTHQLCIPVLIRELHLRRKRAGPSPLSAATPDI